MLALVFKNQQHQLGFTLLELLLVIALVTAMSVVGLSLYKHWAQQLKIQKTALQMQQWLSAGMTYFAREGHWPDQYGDLKDYLPVAHQNNPWGMPYSFMQENQGKVFRVISRVPKLPQTGGVNMSRILARRIAARLPNANVINGSGGEQVIAEVGIPGEAKQGAQHAELISITPINADQDVTKLLPTKAQCPPASRHPEVYFSLIGFTGPKVSSRRNPTTSPIVNLAVSQHLWKPDPVHQRYQITGVNNATAPTNTGQLLAIVTCEPGKGELVKHQLGQLYQNGGFMPHLPVSKPNFIF